MQNSILSLAVCLVDVSVTKQPIKGIYVTEPYPAKFYFLLNIHTVHTNCMSTSIPKIQKGCCALCFVCGNGHSQISNNF